jgi:hypothetical protein
MRKPIRPDSWRKRSSIMESQVELFCLLIDDLEESFSLSAIGPISERAAYQRFLLGARALGFVCDDFSHDGQYLSRARREGWIESRSFIELRRYVHTLIRAERAASEVIDEGLGHIEDAVRTRVLQRVSRTLRSNSEWREIMRAST